MKGDPRALQMVASLAERLETRGDINEEAPVTHAIDPVEMAILRNHFATNDGEDDGGT